LELFVSIFRGLNFKKTPEKIPNSLCVLGMAFPGLRHAPVHLLQQCIASLAVHIPWDTPVAGSSNRDFLFVKHGRRRNQYPGYQTWGMNSTSLMD